MKKWIIIIAAVFLTMGTGVVVPLIINSEKEEPKKSGATEVSLSTQTPIPGLTVTPSSNTGENSESTAALSGQATPDVATTDKSGTTSAGKVSTAAGHTQAGPGKNNPASTPVLSKVQEQPANWVEARIQKHKDEIDPGDLADFRRIYPRVDIGYIQSVSKDGYTSEEIDQVKAYLRGTLGGDYERAKELFYKYNHLLSDDE